MSDVRRMHPDHVGIAVESSVTLEVAAPDAAIRGLDAAEFDVLDRTAFAHWAEAFVLRGPRRARWRG
jgi:hypothetical protein